MTNKIILFIKEIYCIVIPLKIRKYIWCLRFCGIANGLRHIMSVNENCVDIPKSLPHDIPIFIVSYNRLTCLKLLIGYLCEHGYVKNIVIIDNASTYVPLLEYLNSVQVKVVKLKKNYGHLVLWKCGLFNEIIDHKPFVLTDCDVLPVEECPKDFMEKFHEILLEDTSLCKVGFSLKLDDIPDYYKLKDKVIAWEKKFWKSENYVRKGKISYYKASIDTTFALYRPGIYPCESKWWNAARTDIPYIARHLGWYVDVANDDEIQNYIRSVKTGSSGWYSKELHE